LPLNAGRSVVNSAQGGLSRRPRSARRCVSAPPSTVTTNAIAAAAVAGRAADAGRTDAKTTRVKPLS